jgi:hypothetical protein
LAFKSNKAIATRVNTTILKVKTQLGGTISSHRLRIRGHNTVHLEIEDKRGLIYLSLLQKLMFKDRIITMKANLITKGLKLQNQDEKKLRATSRTLTDS